MDPEAVRTLIGVAGTLGGTLLGYVVAWLTENRRREWEERHRFTDARRQAYAHFLGVVGAITKALEHASEKDPVDERDAFAGFADLDMRAAEVSVIAKEPVVTAIMDLYEEIEACWESIKGGDREALQKRRLNLNPKFRRAIEEMRREVGTGSLPPIRERAPSR